MHARLSDSGGLLGQVGIVVGFVLDRRPATEAVHQPGPVELGHPVRSEELDIADPMQRATPERGIASPTEPIDDLKPERFSVSTSFTAVFRQNLMPITDSLRHGEHDARPDGLPAVNRKSDWGT